METAPPAISSTPNLGCQARTGGLVVPRPGETTGSANLSDELSRSKGVICVIVGVTILAAVTNGVSAVGPHPATGDFVHAELRLPSKNRRFGRA